MNLLLIASIIAIIIAIFLIKILINIKEVFGLNWIAAFLLCIAIILTALINIVLFI